MQAKADSYGIVHLCHLGIAQMSHMLPKPALVNGANLLQQHNGVLAQANTAACNVDGLADGPFPSGW